MKMADLKAAAVSAASFITRLVRQAQTAQIRRQERFHDRAARGVVLLRDWLSPEQRAQFERFNFFDVTGSDSGRSYRIQYGASANIVELDCKHEPVMGWCFVPVGDLVPGDVMLAQKIALETDERAALAVARQFLVPPLPPHLMRPR
jgi:hypothetical protein